MVHGPVDLLVLLQLLLDLLVGLTLLLLLVVLVLSLFCFQDSPWQLGRAWAVSRGPGERVGVAPADRLAWRKLGSSGRSTKGGQCLWPREASGSQPIELECRGSNACCGVRWT